MLKANNRWRYSLNTRSSQSTSVVHHSLYGIKISHLISAFMKSSDSCNSFQTVYFHRHLDRNPLGPSLPSDIFTGFENMTYL